MGAPSCRAATAAAPIKAVNTPRARRAVIPILSPAEPALQPGSVHFMYTEYYHVDSPLTNKGEGASRILGQTIMGEVTWIAAHF